MLASKNDLMKTLRIIRNVFDPLYDVHKMSNDIETKSYQT